MELEAEIIEPADAGFFTPEEQEEREETAIDFLLRMADTPNIAEEIDETELTAIGGRVVQEYEIDEESRTEWKTRYDKALEIARQTLEQKSYPWPGASNIRYPLINTAAMQFHARAYPAIISGNDVVRSKIVGADVDGAKKDRGDRIAAHMSYQLLEEMEEWEEDTDKLLLILAVTGSVFRKTYYSPSLGRNVSEMATADKVIVNYGAKSLERAPRVTHEIELYPHEVTERRRSGIFLDVDLPEETGDDPTKPIVFLEQHRLEDLDDDGYPEPYVVTAHKESGKVVRITARYDADSIMVEADKSLGDVIQENQEYNQNVQRANQANEQKYQGLLAQGTATIPPQPIPEQPLDLNEFEVQRIEPVQFFTMYGFIPPIDGGFYYDGFGTLLLPLNEAINSNINMLLDAGHVANTGGGFIGSTLKLSKKSAGRLSFRPHEFKQVDTGGAPVRDAIYQLQFPGPSAVLFSLLGMLIEAGREISSVKDIMTGEGDPRQTATATLALIEQGQKVFSSIYKRIYRALSKELKKLRDLNAKYLPPHVYFNVIDSPQPVEVTLEDYKTGDIDVIPVSDPTIATDAQIIQRANALMSFNGDPLINQMQIRMDMLKALKVESPEAYINQEPPQPDPRIELEKAKLQNEQMKIENERLQIENDVRKTSAEVLKMAEEVGKIRSEIIKNLAEAEAKEVGAQLDFYEARMMSLMSSIEGRISGRSVDMGRQLGGGAGMAPRPADQGVPQVPGGMPVADEQLPGMVGPEQI